MAILSNTRHEKFAQFRAQGETTDAAYVLAGFKANRGNAARLNANDSIRKRIAELQNKGAEKAAVTIDSLAAELDEAREIAKGEKQSSAMVQATMGKAKLFGLIIDKTRHSGPNGGPIPTVDLTNLTDADIDRLEAIFGPLAGAAGDDGEGDSGGASSP